MYIISVLFSLDDSITLFVSYRLIGVSCPCRYCSNHWFFRILSIFWFFLGFETRRSLIFFGVFQYKALPHLHDDDLFYSSLEPLFMYDVFFMFLLFLFLFMFIIFWLKQIGFATDRLNFGFLERVCCVLNEVKAGRNDLLNSRIDLSTMVCIPIVLLTFSLAVDIEYTAAEINVTKY